MSGRKSEAYEDRLLLGGDWLPVTSCVMFVNTQLQFAVDVLLRGRGRRVMELYGSPLRSRPVSAASLEGFLQMLVPLDVVEGRRILLLPTRDPEWTALLDSRARGLDAGSPMAWYKVAGIRSVSVTDVPHSYRLATNTGFYGERKIEMYDIAGDGQVRGHTLGVRTMNTRKWEVAGGHSEFPMGNVWDPDARRIPDRFTHDHLVEMTARLGLRPFDEDFYAPDGHGVIVERTDPSDPTHGTMSLAQARREEPWEL